MFGVCPPTLVQSAPGWNPCLLRASASRNPKSEIFRPIEALSREVLFLFLYFRSGAIRKAGGMPFLRFFFGSTSQLQALWLFTGRSYKPYGGLLGISGLRVWDSHVYLEGLVGVWLLWPVGPPGRMHQHLRASA